MPDRRKKKSMKSTYIAVVLGAFLAAMTASGASYISTKEAVKVQDIRIIAMEQASIESNEIHKEINKSLKSLSESNMQMRIALTRIATVIEIKVENKGG